jgi:hypothetical protein
MRNAERKKEDGEAGIRNSECGMRNEKKKTEKQECEIRTRRRPIRRDYAAAKDAASGLSEL